MAWRRQRILDDREVEAGVDDAGSVEAYAARRGVHPSTVSQALTRIRTARGEPPGHSMEWEDRLGYRPTVA